MRIIHLAPHCHDIGNGVVNVAIDLACRQADTGHAVAFASNEGSLDGLLRNHGVRHFKVDQESRNLLKIARTLIDMRRILSSYKPDIVHAHMVPGALLAWVARLGTNARLVTTVHNEPQRQAVLMGVGHTVIAVSKAVSDSMVRRGIAARKMRVINNGPLGSPRRQPLIESGEKANSIARPAITTVARLFKQKGIDNLITAFCSIADAFPDAHLYLIGEGPERAEFEALAAAASCRDRIHFVGFTSNPRAYLEQSDIFVLASRKDPFPLVVPEAREAGCAIIATNVDGIPDALEGGQAGILIPPSNPSALAAALKRLLANPAELADWRRRAASGIAWLHVDRVVAETLSAYRDTLGQPFEPVPRQTIRRGLT
jgi:glycosyltransferase involved in cell wall biosynthesis